MMIKVSMPVGPDGIQIHDSQLEEDLFDFNMRFFRSLAGFFNDARNLFYSARWIDGNQKLIHESFQGKKDLLTHKLFLIPIFQIKIELLQSYILRLSDFRKSLDAKKPRYLFESGMINKKILSECANKIDHQFPDLIRYRNRISHQESRAKNPEKNQAKDVKYEDDAGSFQGALVEVGAYLKDNFLMTSDQNGLFKMDVSFEGLNLVEQCLKDIIAEFERANFPIYFSDGFSEELEVLQHAKIGFETLPAKFLQSPFSR